MRMLPILKFILIQTHRIQNMKYGYLLPKSDSVKEVKMYHPRLKGDHYEMGLHYGELLYKAGETLSDVIKLTEKQKDFAFASLPVYEKYLPNIMEEAKGLAHGLKQKYEDVACWLISLYCFESTHGCSVFAVKGNDHVYFARNMDMFPEFKKTSESVLYMPQDKNAFIAHSTSMIAVEDGLNEHGLAVALTFLLPKSIKRASTAVSLFGIFWKNARQRKKRQIF